MAGYTPNRIRSKAGRFVPEPLGQKLFRRSDVLPNGCWQWTGSTGADGYGTVQAHGKVQRVHRVAYELWRGPIEDGLELDHLCRNIRCINPEHLEPVTHIENCQRGLTTKIPQWLIDLLRREWEESGQAAEPFARRFSPDLGVSSEYLAHALAGRARAATRKAA